MNILLAIDGSGYSDAAVELVANRAWPTGSRVRVITVVEPVNFALDALIAPQAAAAAQMLRQDLTDMLIKAQAQLKEKFGADGLSIEVIEGDPKRVILDNARSYASDLIVIGAHGTGTGFSDTHLGSTAQAVLAHAPCSVTLVDDDDLEALAEKADRHTALSESKLLVVVDESDHAKAVVDSILSRPWADGSEFQILHVVAPVHQHHGGFLRLSNKPEISSFSGDLAKSQTTAGEALVKSVAARIQQQLPKVKVTHHVVVGSIPGMILQIGQDWPADTIFMGSHGRNKDLLEMFLLGGVTSAVVNNTECTVEVIKIKS